MNDLATLENTATCDVGAARTPNELEEVRIKLLGKKGIITEQLKALGSASVEEKKTNGKALNQLKQSITAAIEAREAELKRAEMDARLKTETLDITLPPRPSAQGSAHPISAVTEELIDIFAELGFAVADGPQIEDDWHNFEALNIPPSHPARQMHDTFYLEEKDEKGDPLVLRTHTSPVQIRAMKEHGAPLRVIAPGPTYRCDSDMTHTPMFHQIEGLVIEEGIHFGHLKGCIQQFLAAFFGRDDVPLRFRPSFFPFTEPSAEVDIGCKHTRDGLLIGEGSDWMEIMGCGMVHPKVLEAGGIDTSKYQGFAFGAGIERLAMLKYNIPDLRTFFDSDVRWLEWYGF